ncbi:hypothetical protein CAC42_248 [Sphaceloma murrayae]|uniref:SGS-domain-containing protein n=1 Tax=Sphaceloma murrayae TaxID=2082308 RepID=A0A2K1QN01_9PEZI|nr:hypothetical protein CAC42_248 [Sphaceloma murrayae]
MDHAKRGAEAIEASNYPEAIAAYTRAIQAAPTAPDYFIKRSTAHQRSKPPNYAEALADAEQGVLFAQKRAKRELIIQAQLRRGIALFGLGRYGDAKFVLDVVKRMDPKEKMLGMWENKVAMKLKDLEPAQPGSEVTVKETPEPVAPAPPTQQSSIAPANGSNSSGLTSIAPTAPAQTPASKIRHDWYQNNDSVICTLLAKGVPKDKAQIDIKETSLSITFPLLTESDYEFTLDPLYAPIDPSQSRYSILSTKIEITLKKAQPGQKWHALESSEPIATASSNGQVQSIPKAILQSTTSSAPAYPSSSRTGPKNWDKLAEDLTAKKPKKDDKDSTSTDKKNDDDDDWDYEKEEGDEVNGFFKKLYSGASEDVRKAMVKSFTESGGTALSTNWADVQKAPVPVQPPDGMEARKWEQ